MSDTAPVVRVWRRGTSDWVETGQIGDFSSLSFTPTRRDIGQWSLSMPLTDQALVLAANKAGFVSIDWRGVRTTWRCVTPAIARDSNSGDLTLNVTGVGALQWLSKQPAWPDPSKPLDSQPVVLDTDPAPYSGTAEAVMKQLVTGNMVPIVASGSTSMRSGSPLVTVRPSLGRGGPVSARPRMDSLLDLLRNLAGVGGLEFDLGLVDTTPGHADLVFDVWETRDLSRSVFLTETEHTLAEFEQNDTEPTATMAIVAGGGAGGMDRVMQVVTTPDSEAAAAAWGGHTVIFVDGPASFDPAELTQAGQEALLQGAETQNLKLTAAEAEGMQAFTHYNVSDIATGAVVEGAEIVAPISSIKVTFDETGVTVEPTFGDPDAANPDVQLGETVRDMGRRLRKQERK